jgi:hypothetical protein
MASHVNDINGLAYLVQRYVQPMAWITIALW